MGRAEVRPGIAAPTLHLSFLSLFLQPLCNPYVFVFLHCCHTMDQSGLVCPQALPALQLFDNALWPVTFLIVAIVWGCLARSTIVTVSQNWADVVDRLPSRWYRLATRLSTQWAGVVTTTSTQWASTITSISTQWAAALIQASACLFLDAAGRLARGLENAFAVAARHISDAFIFGR